MMIKLNRTNVKEILQYAKEHNGKSILAFVKNDKLMYYVVRDGVDVPTIDSEIVEIDPNESVSNVIKIIKKLIK